MKIDRLFKDRLSKDHLGSTRYVFNSTGGTVAWYAYQPYGDLMVSSINKDIAYKFTGQEYDDETSLWNFRARLYDGSIGRFYAADAAGQGFAPFAYCGNNPISHVDKNGQNFFAVVAVLAEIYSGITSIYSLATSHDLGDFIHNFMYAAFSGATMGTASLSPYMSSGSGSFASIMGRSALMGTINGGVSAMSNNSSFLVGAAVGALEGMGFSAAEYGASYVYDFGDILIQGDNPNESLDPTNEVLASEAAKVDDYNPSEFNSLKVGTNESLDGHEIAVNNQTGELFTDGEKGNEEGLNIWRGEIPYAGTKPDIRIAPAAFSKRIFLHMVLDHEFFHAHLIYSGWTYNHWSMPSSMHADEHAAWSHTINYIKQNMSGATRKWYLNQAYDVWNGYYHFNKYYH